MGLFGWIAVAAAVAAIAFLIYWLLIITEGTYLGQTVVTWLYDVIAHRYDEIKGFDAEIETAYLGRPLVEALGLQHAPLVLDIGTGTGRLPLTLFDQPRFQGRVVGIDDSRKMLRIASEKLKRNCNRVVLIERSASNLPFCDAAFDAVTCLEMLEFTPDPRSVLAEAVRVLRRGGLLLTTRRTGFDARLIPGKTFSESAFSELLAGLGFEHVRIERWQVDYDLVWAVKGGISEALIAHPYEAMTCIRCREPALIEQSQSVLCENCGAEYPISDGIIDLSNFQ